MRKVEMRKVKELKSFIAQLSDDLDISCTDQNDIFFIGEPYHVAAAFGCEERFDEISNETESEVK